jgi:hypothetical protein
MGLDRWQRQAFVLGAVGEHESRDDFVLDGLGQQGHAHFGLFAGLVGAGGFGALPGKCVDPRRGVRTPALPLL